MRFKLTSISADDVAAHRASLQRWQQPAEFSAAVSALMTRFTHGELFNVPALAFLRDAWTLGKFSTLAGADEVGYQTTASLTAS